MAFDPVVFISSTKEDLEEHRDQAARAAQALGFSPRMMEYFPAAGHAHNLQVCREKVAEAEVVVVLVAHRYGWVPDDPTNPDAKSITWLECEHAWNATGKEVLAFLVDSNYAWPAELKEDYRLIQGKDLPDEQYDRLRKEVRRNEAQLKKFKNKLSEKPRATFTDAASVRAVVSAALADWRKRHPAVATLPRSDAESYLKAIHEATSKIRILNLATKRTKPFVFGIEEIYIPLKTHGAQEGGHAGPRTMELERMLSQRKVVIVGDPGSGKSTFLRRVAFELSASTRANPILAADDKRFPILFRVADLAEFLDRSQSVAADWIPRFLGKEAETNYWGVDEDFFRRKLTAGNCLVMVDGLDEAPERHLRERIARIFENATAAFRECDFLVSTRPATNAGDAVLADFHPVLIGDLELPEIRAFFDRFAKALAFSDAASKKFTSELEAALDRPEIAEMARNPVMLSALAVLQHDDQRLPEHRVDLYESILIWLARARHNDDKCLESMRKLALHMQDAPGGRLVQINLRAAAGFFSAVEGSVDAAEAFLERETQETGIVARTGNDLKFWHLSFQEYLAAREIAGLSDEQQSERVVKSGKLYLPEWRETMRLLGGVLKGQGEAKIDGLIQAILDTRGERPDLNARVRCAALLEFMMRDLKRMKYEPKHPEFNPAVKAVMGIFETGEAEKIPIEQRIEAADLLGQVGDPRLEENNWIEIREGLTFHMGAQKKNKKDRNYDEQAYDQESPVHEVTVRPFRIGKYPVTVQEFERFMKDDGYKKSKYWVDGFEKFQEPEDWKSQIQYPSRPVVGVSWFEAAAYCSWKKGRLPTEAEWERAARGPRGTRYPWGNDPPLDPSYANYSGISHPTPVGLFPKGNSAEGVCDLLGNVYEWCEDWYSSYQAGTQVNPIGPKSGDEKILRGGSWDFRPRFVRVSDRNGVGPSVRFIYFGFRCAGELSL